MYKAIGFDIRELVDKPIYELLGEHAWHLFDIRARVTLDRIKAIFGWTIIVNTWMFSSKKYNDATGEPFTQRGFRSQTSMVGVKGGAHYLGLGFDFDAYDKQSGTRIPPDMVRKAILKNLSKFEYIRCLEINVNWVHFDVMGCCDHLKRASITKDKVLLYDPRGDSRIIERS